MNVYAHLPPGVQERGVKEFEAMLGRAEKAPHDDDR